MNTIMKCTKCDSDPFRIESRFCLKCGTALNVNDDTPMQNICTNSECKWSKTKFIYPDNALFCDACGSRTVYAE